MIAQDINPDKKSNIIDILYERVNSMHPLRKPLKKKFPKTITIKHPLPTICRKSNKVNG